MNVHHLMSNMMWLSNTFPMFRRMKGRCFGVRDERVLEVKVPDRFGPSADVTLIGLLPNATHQGIDQQARLRSPNELISGLWTVYYHYLLYNPTCVLVKSIDKKSMKVALHQRQRDITTSHQK
jgi:hypothetical protein